jgi:hypothetical protein
MSSRSFRRRNNRRRHKPTTGTDALGQSPVGQPTDRAAQQGRATQSPQEGTPRGGGHRREAAQGQAGRGSQARATEARPERPEIPIVYPDCPICGKSVRELSSALTHRVSRQPAHFDCIMRELRDSNEMAPQEKLCYLGGGTFGILEFRAQGASSRFVIRKRIQYEEKETPQEWKKQLQISS